MIERSVEQRSRVALYGVAWVIGSLLVHVILLLAMRERQVPDDGPRFALPSRVEFGLADEKPGGGNRSAEPPPAQRAATPPRKQHKAKPPVDPDAYALKHDADKPDPHADKRALAKAAADAKRAALAAHSGEGKTEDALGAGFGASLGDGSGYAPAGATIALNVDLERVRKSALLLETQSLLDIIPEWQQLLVGSGLEPMKDFSRVFVASPTLERASLVVSARHQLPRARIEAAAQQLAAAQGQDAAFREQHGFAVAPWRNRGPTERVIALTGADQFTITRQSDLARVLGVAQALADTRPGQGFDAREVEEQGGLLAMKDKEAVALWVEGVRKYVHGDVPGVPLSLRMSLYHLDQFSTELRVRGQYESTAAATAARADMETLRAQLSNHEKVVFLGLKSALDSAEVEQHDAALLLHVRLTLHQTRYVLRYLKRFLL
jgi:hypothetical protein